jgi:hypothetical protein
MVIYWLFMTIRQSTLQISAVFDERYAPCTMGTSVCHLQLVTQTVALSEENDQRVYFQHMPIFIGRRDIQSHIHGNFISVMFPTQ